MDHEAARALIADEPHYEIASGEGRACSLCGANVLGPDRDRHTRWHRALAEVLGLGWSDLSTRPVDPALADAVDAVVHPRGWAKVSRFVAAQQGWRVVPEVLAAGSPERRALELGTSRAATPPARGSRRFASPCPKRLACCRDAEVYGLRNRARRSTTWRA